MSQNAPRCVDGFVWCPVPSAAPNVRFPRLHRPIGSLGCTDRSVPSAAPTDSVPSAAPTVRFPRLHRTFGSLGCTERSVPSAAPNVRFPRLHRTFGSLGCTECSLWASISRRVLKRQELRPRVWDRGWTVTCFQIIRAWKHFTVLISTWRWAEHVSFKCNNTRWIGFFYTIKRTVSSLFHLYPFLSLCFTKHPLLFYSFPFFASQSLYPPPPHPPTPDNMTHTLTHTHTHTHTHSLSF